MMWLLPSFVAGTVVRTDFFGRGLGGVFSVSISDSGSVTPTLVEDCSQDSNVALFCLGKYSMINTIILYVIVSYAKFCMLFKIIICCLYNTHAYIMYIEVHIWIRLPIVPNNLVLL